MPFPIVIAAVAMAVSAVVSLITAAIQNGDYAKAQQLRQQLADKYGSMALPHLDKALAQEIGPTALAAIKEDPALREQQVGGMRKLSEIYDSAGMTPQDEAALQLANQGAEQRASSDYASLQQQLAARGQQGNPAMMAALASKSGGDVVAATARNRYQAQADARNRAFQALGESTNVAGQIRGQDYGIALNAANASDRIAQFNAQQRTATNQYNNQMTQQEFANQLALQQAQSNAALGVASGIEANAQRTGQTGAGIANSVSTIGGALAQGEAQKEANINPNTGRPWGQ
jgi:hypothetical protein